MAANRHEWHQEIYCLDGQRDGSNIYHVRDGLYYHYSWRRNNTLYFKCIWKSTLGCTGRALVHEEHGFRHTQGHMGHEPDLHLEGEKILRVNVLDRCRSLEVTPFKQILRNERAGFDREVQARLPYVKLRSSMLRARRSQYPPAPNSLEGLVHILMDPQYQVLTQTLDGEDNLFGGGVRTQDGDTHILLTSRRLIRVLRVCRYLFSDGTFKVVPAVDSLQNRRAQVFHIVTTWRGHTLAVAWALMENRTKEAYVGVLQLMRNLVGGNVNIRTVVTDDEIAQQQAWDEVFDVRLQNCLWHLCRAFVNMILSLGLGGWFFNQNVPEFMHIVKMSCALPLLPQNRLVLGWRILRRETRIVGGNFLRNLMNPYLEYLWNNYVGHARRRFNMTCFGSDHRTNNCVESANRGLLDELGPHPGIYDFLNGILNLEDQAYLDYLTLDQGRHASRARKTSAIANDAALQTLGEELQAAPFGDEDAVRRYMRAASYRVANIVADFAGLNNNNADD